MHPVNTVVNMALVGPKVRKIYWAGSRHNVGENAKPCHVICINRSDVLHQVHHVDCHSVDRALSKRNSENASTENYHTYGTIIKAQTSKCSSRPLGVIY